jgi:hypothetical protein
VVGLADRSRIMVMKDSCEEHAKMLRHYLNEYAGQQPLLVGLYKDVYERT